MMKQSDIYVGRQPIFNSELRVYGYELLFRDGLGRNAASFINGEEATIRVILNTFGELGLKDVVGEGRAFINFTEGLLAKDIRRILPARQVVIEVLEDTPVTPELLTCLQNLRNQGYTVALDDYVFNPQLAPLEGVADIIKVDILLTGPKPLIEHVPRLTSQGVRLLAEKVETQEQFLFCKKLGFDYFQGYFFAKPKIIEGKALPPNKMSILKLMARLYDPQVNLVTLGEIIEEDVVLSEKLIKFASLSLPASQRIHSVKDAVIRFGLDRLQTWGSMLALTMIEDKPAELFKVAYIRARACELLGESIGQPAPEVFYTVGLFSTLDALMDKPLEMLLEQMQLDPLIIEALLHRKGALGQVLRIVEAMERTHPVHVLPPPLTAAEVTQAMLKAMQEAERLALKTA